MLSLVLVTGCQRDTEGAGRKQAPSLARPGQARAGQEGWAHRPGSDSWGVPQGTSHPPSVPRLRVSSGLWVTGHPVTRGLGRPCLQTPSGQNRQRLQPEAPAQAWSADRRGLCPGSPAGGSWLRLHQPHHTQSGRPCWSLDGVHPALSGLGAGLQQSQPGVSTHPPRYPCTQRPPLSPSSRGPQDHPAWPQRSSHDGSGETP